MPEYPTSEDRCMPAISVIVGAYNHEAFVEGCLESVRAQTFRDFELIVFDDCSSDKTPERVREWAARTGTPLTFIVNEQNLGLCASRNRALSVARGTYVSTLAADDIYEPDKLERQHRCFESCPPNIAVVYSDITDVDVDGNAVVIARKPLPPAPPEGDVFDALLRWTFIRAPAVMMRRSALDEVGGYDETLAAEDEDMWLRLADRFEFRFCPGRVTRKRNLLTSLSHAPEYSYAMLESRVRVFSKWYGRSPESDAAIDARLDGFAYRARRAGRRRIIDDRADGLRLLALADRLRPSVRTKLLRGLVRVPGSVEMLRRGLSARNRLRPH
jgi:glycosyltransferase involved in cell wall biosynthesis